MGIQKQSADFTPYITQVLPLKSKKSLSPTKVVSSKHTYFIQQQTSEDILSPILDILSQRPVRSPEKKFEYVQGLKETLLEDNFVQVTKTETGSELRRGSSSSYSDHSPKASPRSSSRSSSGASSHGSSNDDLQDLKETERE